MFIVILSINSISPNTNPELFNKEVEGSLYHMTNLTALLMLKHRGSNALIPIEKVFDMALDPSGPAREFGNKAVIYMWTRKLDGRQYVGSTSNAKNCFGKRYNSPNSLIKSPSFFNYSLATEGRHNYYLTILAVVPSTPVFRLPI